MTRIPLFNLFTKIDSSRSIYSTRKDEVRYFIIDGEDNERKLRVTGTAEGGLRVETLEDGKWCIDTTALPRLGDTVTEVPFIQ